MIVGGLRARLVKESLYNMINDSLRSLGWFDAGRQHRPVEFRDHEVPDDDEILPNMVALADENMDSSEYELGSLLSEHNWTFYVDVYAENDAIGIHLSHDIKSILEGRLPSIGRSTNWFNLINYASPSATPVVFGTAEITNVTVHKAHGFPKTWQKHWYSVPLLVVDIWADESDA